MIRRSRRGTVTRGDRVAGSTRRAAVNARRVGLAFLAMLAVVLLPTEAWGAAPAAGSWDPASLPGVILRANAAPYGSNATGSVTVAGTATYMQQTAPTSLLWTWQGPTGVSSGGTVMFRAYYRCTNTPAGSWLAGQSGGGAYNSSTGQASAYLFSSANTCTTSGTGLELIRLDFATAFDATSGNPTAYGSSMTYYPGNSPAVDGSASSCTAPAGNVQTSYVSGKLSLSFTWSSTIPASGWNLRAGSLNVSPGLTVIPKTLRVGTTNRYGFDGLTTSAVGVGSTLRLESVNTPGCYSLITVGSSTSVTDPSASDPSGAGDCSTLDLFCQLRAAFTPSQASLNSWNAMTSQLSTVVPFGYVTASVSLLQDMFSPCGIPACYDPLASASFHVLGTDVRPFQDNSVMSWLAANRGPISALIWAAVITGLVSFVWVRMVPLLGNNGD